MDAWKSRRDNGRKVCRVCKEGYRLNRVCLMLRGKLKTRVEELLAETDWLRAARTVGDENGSQNFLT